ncbi:MAG: hypothetical protein Q7S50_03290 [bacterium]|nr:hypothetical protein [bacterium]
MARERPRRIPKKWGDDTGRGALDVFSGLRAQYEKADAGRSMGTVLEHKTLVGTGIMFYDALKKLEDDPASSCFKPLRFEIEWLANKTGLREMSLVSSTLAKLVDDEKSRATSKKAALLTAREASPPSPASAPSAQD